MWPVISSVVRNWRTSQGNSQPHAL